MTRITPLQYVPESEEERRQIKATASAAGLSINQFIREAIRSHYGWVEVPKPGDPTVKVADYRDDKPSK